MANHGFGENMHALANTEPEGPLVENLRTLGNIHKRIRELHEKQVTSNPIYL